MSGPMAASSSAERYIHFKGGHKMDLACMSRTLPPLKHAQVTAHGGGCILVSVRKKMPLNLEDLARKKSTNVMTSATREGAVLHDKHTVC